MSLDRAIVQSVARKLAAALPTLEAALAWRPDLSLERARPFAVVRLLTTDQERVSFPFTGETQDFRGTLWVTVFSRAPNEGLYEVLDLPGQVRDALLTDVTLYDYSGASPVSKGAFLVEDPTVQDLGADAAAAGDDLFRYASVVTGEIKISRVKGAAFITS
ncbi:MAG: hypothetical protein KJ576_20890 [Proteobacteria bacterium]|nr:hypothetical protein [Pseudomonadota bacterium]